MSPNKGSMLKYSAKISCNLFVSVGVLLIMISCSPDTRYLILNTLIDGVPDKDEYFGRVEEVAEEAREDSTQISDKGPGQLTARETTAVPERRGSKHQPFADRNCSVCHNIGKGNALVMAADKLCYSCHPDYEHLSGYLHGPVAVSACSACHDAHESKEDHLLARAGDRLCTFCHKNVGDTYSSDHRALAETGCLSCHRPHSDDNSRFFLRAEGG